MKELEEAAEKKYPLLDDKYEIMPASKKEFNSKQLELRSAFIAGAQQSMPGWVDVETPPDDSRYVRVLVNGKHNIHPHFYIRGQWFDPFSGFPVDLKISHWKDFEDLTK